MRKIFFVALLLATPIISACNTVEGAGQDVAKVGDHISDRAEQVKDGN